MRYDELLTEMLWDDRYEAAKVARQYPRAWIHFSHINKIGVNPQKQHHDPPGIYFYPVSFLFSDRSSLSQFATEYEYFFIVRFKKTANIINLGKITMEDVTRIATANNWVDDLREIMAHPELLAKQGQPMEKRLLRRPGGMFYAAIDYLANIKHRPWLGLLKGCDGLYDPGYGFISAGETAQAVVFGRQHFTIVAQGDNVDHGEREYAKILQQVAGELGGRFYYHNKEPIADFANDGRPFRITLRLNWGMIELALYQRGFWMVRQEKYSTFAGDRANHYRSIKYYVERTAQEAEAPPETQRYWNGETAAALLKAIRPATKINQRLDDDGLHVWESSDFLGNVYSVLLAIVDASDHIRVNVELSLDDKFECKISQTFDAQPIAEIAKTILDELARQLIERVPNSKALKGYRIAGFDFGDRFDAV